MPSRVTLPAWPDLPLWLALGAAAGLGMFLNGVMIGTAGVMVLAFAIAVRRRGIDAPRPDRSLLLVAALLLGVALLSLATPLSQPQALTPGVSARKVVDHAINLLLIAILPVLLSLRWETRLPAPAPVRRDWSVPFTAQAAVVAALLAAWEVEALRGSVPPPFEVNRALQQSAMLVWPVAAAALLAGRVRGAVLALAAMTALALFGHSATAGLAMGLGLVAFAACRRWPQPMPKVLAGLAVALSLGMPLLAKLAEPLAVAAWLPFSWRERAAIWNSLADRLPDLPPFGFGPKAPSIYGWTLPPEFAEFAGRPMAYAHNGPLQVLVDYGWPGLLLFTLLVGVLALRVGRFGPRTRPFAAALFTAGFVCAGLGLDIWTDSFLVAAALSALWLRLLDATGEPAAPRILFLGWTRVGDGVMSTVALAELLRRHPAGRVTLVCGPLAAEVLRHMPNLEALMVLRKKPWNRHWLELARRLAFSRWDLVVDLRDSVIPFLVESRRILRLKGGRRPLRKVDELAALLRLETTPWPAVWLTAAERDRAAELLPTDLPLIAIAPGAGRPEKLWPPERFVAAFADLTAAGPPVGARLLLVGAPGEEALAVPFRMALGEGRIIDLIGGAPLLVQAAAVARASLFLGNDSGFTHIAAALGVPTLAVFGPTDPRQYAPFGPCSGYVGGTVGNGPSLAMTDVPVPEVVAAAQALLSRDRPPSPQGFAPKPGG